MSGWGIGFVVGAAVVVVVAVLLVTMIVLARSVASKAEAILAALHETRDNTQALWAVRETNTTTIRIAEAAAAAREALASRGGRR